MAPASSKGIAEGLNNLTLTELRDEDSKKAPRGRRSPASPRHSPGVESHMSQPQPSRSISASEPTPSSVCDLTSPIRSTISRSSSISHTSSSSDNSQETGLSTASTSSARSTTPPENFYGGLPAQGFQRTAYLLATRQVYGTYDLGGGRRGAISGPSTNYYEGKYKRGRLEGRRGHRGESGGTGYGWKSGRNHEGVGDGDG